MSFSIIRFRFAANEDRTGMLIDKCFDLDSAAIREIGSIDFPDQNAPLEERMLCTSGAEIDRKLTARRHIKDIVLRFVERELDAWLSKSDTKMGYPKEKS